MTSPNLTLDDLAKLLGCAPGDVAGRVAELTAVDAHRDVPFTVRPKRALTWNRKTVPYASALAASRDRNRTHERRARVWQLRKDHHSLDAISKEVGVSVRTVRQDLQYWFDALVPPDIEQRRTLELDALDDMSRRILDEATADAGRLDLDAVKVWLTLRKRYDNLSGLERVPPMNVILPSSDQWADLIEAVAGPQSERPFIDGEVLDVESVEAAPSLAELVEAVAS